MIPNATADTLVKLRLLQSQVHDIEKKSEILVLQARVMRQMGMFRAAREVLQAATEATPDHPHVLRSLGLELFRDGKVAEGLTLYDKGRWQLPAFEKYRRDFKAVFWSGEPLHGKRLLLWAEQGIGDQVMQMRALRKLLRTGADIVLEADPRLFPLLDGMAEQVELHPQTVPPQPAITRQAFDFQSSLLSAWRFLDTPLSEGACLTADPALSARYRSAWAQMGPARNVGLSWMSRNEATGAARSVDLSLLRPLSEKPGIRFHSLQYGAPDLKVESSKLGAPILSDPGVNPLKRLTEQAAQIAAMDLVITIDNATAHLAGALGVPVWILLPKGAEWRWGTGVTATPLYPTARLFRATDTADWAKALWDLFAAFDAW